MGVFDYANTNPKAYLNLGCALAGGTPDSGGVPFVNTHPKAYIDAEVAAAGGSAGTGYVNTNPKAYIDSSLATLTPEDPGDTTPPTTTIDSGPSGTVTDNTPTFTFSSNEPGQFEARMDGGAWAATASPKTYAALAIGEHTFEVRAVDAVGNVDATPASRTFTVEAVSAPTDLPLLAELDTTGDWNSVLDTAPGSVIENVTKDGEAAIRLWQPDDGERTELQVHQEDDGGVPSHGYETFYTWEFQIPSPTTLYAGDVTICQWHGDNQAGYTGGLVIYATRGPEKLWLRVKGGVQTSAAGSHRYTWESDRGDHAIDDADMLTAAFSRDVWNLVEYHVHWTDQGDGFARLRFNGGSWIGPLVYATSSNIADTQMFRVGWYPGSDPVPASGLEMFVRRTKVYGRAVPYP